MRPSFLTPPPAQHVRVLGDERLSDNWYVLRKLTIELRRRGGTWQQQTREVYDRGNGAAILLVNVRRQTVVLTRQFRLPAWVNGCADGMLIEACAGLLDGDDPETCIRREAAEETGFRIQAPHKVFEAYMSPGSVTEKLHFFVVSYESSDRTGEGGGIVNEGEDIEVIELLLEDALAMVRSGAIEDAKTIMLLQHAKITGLDRLLPLRPPFSSSGS